MLFMPKLPYTVATAALNRVCVAKYGKRVERREGLEVGGVCLKWNLLTIWPGRNKDGGVGGGKASRRPVALSLRYGQTRVFRD
jgi:hypothetical protein